MENYYVVKKGLKPGIYKTWAECKSAVDGFKGAVFRKFNSFEEANTFYKMETTSDSIFASKNNKNIKTERATSTPTPIPKEENEKIQQICNNIKSTSFSNDLNFNVGCWNCLNDEIYIFVDGSSRNNKEILNSGIGVYLGHKCMNIKEQYSNKTNNQCELTAMDYAFKLVIKYYLELANMGKVIKIVSDSEYSIKACSIWLNQWKKNDWKTSNGEPVKNRELIESIDASMQKIKTINYNLEEVQKIRIKLIHINSHQSPDLQDKFKFSIWFGNYVADGLARNII